MILFKTNPVILRTNSLISRTNPVIFRTNPVILRTKPVIFRVIPGIFSTNTVIFRTNQVVFLTNTAIFWTNHVIFVRSTICKLRPFEPPSRANPIILPLILLNLLRQEGRLCQGPISGGFLPRSNKDLLPQSVRLRWTDTIIQRRHIVLTLSLVNNQKW